MSFAMWHLIGIAVYLKMIFNPGFADKADLNIFWYWIIGLASYFIIVGMLRGYFPVSTPRVYYRNHNNDHDHDHGGD